MSEIKTNKISSLDSSNSDITIEPDGTGKVAIPAAVEVDSNDITVAFDGADDVNSLILQGSNGSSEKYTFELQADGGNSAAKFMIGSGGGAASEKMRLLSGGALSIGGTSARTSDSKLELVTPSNTANVLYMLKSGQVEVAMGFKSSTDQNFYIGTGSTNVGTHGVYLTNTGNSWTSVSDERKKTVVEPISNASEKVSSLRTVIGYFNHDEDQTRRPFLMAQDVQAVLPEAVSVQQDDDSTLGLAYTDVIPLLTAALKESITKIETLETENSTQAAQIADLITRVTALENA